LGVCTEEEAAESLGRTGLGFEDISPADGVFALVLDAISDLLHFGDHDGINRRLVCQSRDDQCGLIVTVMGYKPAS
jgi:hypothetical protein